MNSTSKRLLAILRICLGWLFLWAFIDKLFGLGFATKTEQSWINGGSPTTGFLAHAPNALVHSLAGQPWIDCLFMVGLLGLGLALILGIGLRIAAVTGTLLMLSMWFASWPLVNNPIIDEHIIYAGLFLLWPQVTPTPNIVKRWPWLA